MLVAEVALHPCMHFVVCQSCMCLRVLCQSDVGVLFFVHCRSDAYTTLIVQVLTPFVYLMEIWIIAVVTFFVKRKTTPVYDWKPYVRTSISLAVFSYTTFVDGPYCFVPGCWRLIGFTSISVVV